MNQYISSFPTGFGEVVRECLPHVLPGAKVIGVYDGLVLYGYSGDFRKISRVPFFNNTFHVLEVFGKRGLSFPQMVRVSCAKKYRYLIGQGSFRVRFSKANQFAKVDRQLAVRAEEAVKHGSRLRADRVNPDTEFWYIIRSEGVGFYCQLLGKRTATEKTLHQGELRPEFAYLMCCCGKIGPKDRVCDPFCGYGAIPRQIAAHFSFGTLLASDLDGAKVQTLKKSALGRDARIMFFRADALGLKEIPDEGVDVVITDPPWGYYEKIEDIAGFYSRMLCEFSRILTKGGRVVVLSARREELEGVLREYPVKLKRRIDTLVNGKKASVYVLGF